MKGHYCRKLVLFIGTLTKGSFVLASLLATVLRQNGLKILVSDSEVTIKNGYKIAERHNAKHILFLGIEDLKKQTMKIKNLTTKNETEFSFEKIEEMIGFFTNE